VLTFADIAFDTHRRQVVRGSRGIALTPKETAVLELLLRADGGVASSEYLLEKAWDDNRPLHERGPPRHPHTAQEAG
jgi:DNA-binding response OmpR family regulator